MCQDLSFPPCKRICSVLLMTGGPLVVAQSLFEELIDALVMSIRAGSEAKPLFCHVESVEGAG